MSVNTPRKGRKWPTRENPEVASEASSGEHQRRRGHKPVSEGGKGKREPQSEQQESSAKPTHQERRIQRRRRNLLPFPCLLHVLSLGENSILQLGSRAAFRGSLLNAETSATSRNASSFSPPPRLQVGETRQSTTESTCAEFSPREKQPDGKLKRVSENV